MARNSVVKILRGTKKNSRFIPERGEIVWGTDTNEIVIGDGKTEFQYLNGVSNIVKAPNGRLYAVEIDNFGHATTKPLTVYNRNRYTPRTSIKYDLYAE